MVSSEALHKLLRKADLAVHEDQVIGDKHVVEDDGSLLPTYSVRRAPPFSELVRGARRGITRTKLAVALVYVGAVDFQRARVARLPAIDVRQASRINRHSADRGVVLVTLNHAAARHSEQPVGVDSACLMHFGATDHNTVDTAFDDAYK